ncbi:MAG: ATP-binding protein, partial [Candidatus Bathyarchaeota archaeon]
MKAPPEKLGSFFLGSEYDLEMGEITGEQINYDARDLTTHAVCIGMTGSGKTGLCICLLEEAALDKVPAIIIDPKGDITNHLLHFPELQSTDFLEWINIDDARRKNLTKEEYANQLADTWKKGLESWGIGKKRINELSESVDFTIYTPGSNAGVPINILSSLEAPKYENNDTLNSLITGTTGALLKLIKINQDPVRSKEGILLSSILHHHWSQNQNLSLEKLIQQVQNPPFNRLGVFDLETFYPEEKRLELALALNSLLASPSFTEWLTGDSLDISALLYKENGKPRHSIFSLAHLGEEERMFFVTLLLERISTWMQGQSGTTSLRALLYFDEVFGYMPPVANPPSKTPLLRLLKQGRAYGLGVVLTTQNPVDLDYKGLTNTGTWFIGKLQTERDKARVLEGLESAAQLSFIESKMD